ncbi:carboxylesterase [Tricladium varicosporioides]|nr:carboxylesterase [Hymenoscyphus varicosporioides]
MISKDRPRVTVRQGIIVGVKSDGANEKFPQILDTFLGIPYGMPTDRNRRFWRPDPVDAGDGEFDAGKLGHRCPAGPEDEVEQSENCLNLNIYRPTRRKEGVKLPVLVYFHGGAFNSGFGANRQISSFVAWSSKPMIGISFNYRIGALGFLPSKLAQKEGLLNIGLKDQELLLVWVKENIAAFGGDPDNVTIMGSSAGAHSVGHHLLHNPDSPPLFHKAIIESGAATARAVYPADNVLHEQQFREFLGYLGLRDHLPDSNIFTTLRTLPVAKIKAASEAIYTKYDESLRWPFQPVIDGEGGMIPIAPIDAWKSGKWHKVPLITGFNTNEGAMFVPSNLNTTTEFTSFFKTLLPNLSPEDLVALQETYPDPVAHPESKYVETRAGKAPQFSRTEQAYGHFAYVAPVKQTAQFAVKGGLPVYLYHFAVKSHEDGTDHGDHNSFVTYDKKIRDESPSIREVSAKMHAYWSSFVTTGDPNLEEGQWKERATWPKYSGEGGKMAVFGEGNDEIPGGGHRGVAVQIVEDGWAREECKFWMNRTEKFESN